MWCICLSPLSLKCEADWNMSTADGKWGGHNTGGVAVMGVIEWERIRGSREEKGGSREESMMSLWVILLTGNHAVLIVVIGFSWVQKKAGTSLGVFTESYFGGQQLSYGLWVDEGCICMYGSFTLTIYSCNASNLIKTSDSLSKVDRSKFCAKKTDISTHPLTSIMKT